MDVGETIGVIVAAVAVIVAMVTLGVVLRRKR